MYFFSTSFVLWSMFLRIIERWLLRLLAIYLHSVSKNIPIERFVASSGVIFSGLIVVVVVVYFILSRLL